MRVAAQAGVAADGDTLAVTPGVNGYVQKKLYTGRYTWQHSTGESRGKQTVGESKTDLQSFGRPGRQGPLPRAATKAHGHPAPTSVRRKGVCYQAVNGLLNGLSEEKCWDCEQLQRSVCMQARVHARCVRDSACAAHRRVPVYVCVRQQGLVQRMYMHMNHTKRCVARAPTARLSAPGQRLVRPIQKVVLQP